MRKISSTEFALAAALFAVSGATALADNFVGQSASPTRTASVQPIHLATPVRDSQDSAN